MSVEDEYNEILKDIQDVLDEAGVGLDLKAVFEKTATIVEHLHDPEDFVFWVAATQVGARNHHEVEDLVGSETLRVAQEWTEKIYEEISALEDDQDYRLPQGFRDFVAAEVKEDLQWRIEQTRELLNTQL